MRVVESIIFDLDNTLFEEFTYFEKVLQVFAEKHSIIDFSIENFRLFFNEIRPNSKDILKSIITEFFGMELTKYLHDSLYNTYVSTIKDIPLYTDGKEILNLLYASKIKLGLLTNGVVQAQQCKVESLNLEPFFDQIIYARNWGSKFEKPHEFSFDKVTKALEVDFRNCIFVGDNPKTDFRVPATKGAYTVRLLRGPNQIVPSTDYVHSEISKLTELNEFI